MDQQLMGSIRDKRMGQAKGDNLYFSTNLGLKIGSSPHKNLQDAMFQTKQSLSYSPIPNIEQPMSVNPQQYCCKRSTDYFPFDKSIN